MLSSVGRAAPLQGVGQRFDPVSTHHFDHTKSTLLKSQVLFCCRGLLGNIVMLLAQSLEHLQMCKGVEQVESAGFLIRFVGHLQWLRNSIEKASEGSPFFMHPQKD